MTADLHHVLENIRLRVSVTISLRFADDAVVFKEEDVAVVAPGG